jgi:hypothetical protein
MPLARMNDSTKHCGGTGPITEGSPDVMIDDGAAAASGLGASAAQALQVLLRNAKEMAQGQATKASDTHDVHWADVSQEVVEQPPTQAAAAPSPQPAQVLVQLVDSTGVAVAGWAYELTLPDGTVLRGETDGQGRIQAEAGTQQGPCTLVFPGQRE